MDHSPERISPHKIESHSKVNTKYSNNPTETQISEISLSDSAPLVTSTNPINNEQLTVKAITNVVGCSSSKQVVNRDGINLNQLEGNENRSNRSEILASSSFSRVFLRDYSTKGVLSNNLEASQKGPFHEDVSSNTLANKNLIYSNEIIEEEPELAFDGLNLREWLESRGPDVRKIESLRLFKLVVHAVDNAHSQGIVFLELQPSSFILLPAGNVKYTGSRIEIEQSAMENWDFIKKRSSENEMSAHGKFVLKKQKLGKSSIGHCRPTFQLENEWYACPEGIDVKDLLSFNIYCLGILLFEFLSHFETLEEHSAAVMSLHHPILPPNFVSENPKEAGICFWLLNPEPSSRPTAREILQFESIYGFEDTSPSNNSPSFDDAESELLFHFLVSLEQHKLTEASKLLESLKFLEVDISEIEKRRALRIHSKHKPYNTRRENVLREKLFKNFSQLEDAYFCMRSRVQICELPNTDRSDKDILTNREKFSQFQYSQKTKEEEPVENFFDGICKFARHNKFEVCGTLRNDNILNSNNVICSLSLDREEEYIAAAGVSKKIKIFELSSLLNDSVDVHYPVLEMSNESKISCICWNNYIKNYLASTDVEGVVQMWDTSTGQGFSQYKEHQKRAWSVDFSQVDPTKFASGSDDCSIRIWNINERNSIGTIWNPANVCCVQFSSFSSHLLAYSCSDYMIYCYDLRHTKIPWCTLSGHGKAVSYVRFLDSDTLVSSSTDNTLKIWDLKKTSLEGLSSKSCILTSSGHTNVKVIVPFLVEFRGTLGFEWIHSMWFGN